jgi:hypothetical protein
VISTPYYYYVDLIRAARFARTWSTGSSFASLGRADRGAAPETPKIAPSGHAASPRKVKTPRGAQKPSSTKRSATRLTRPSLRSGTAPSHTSHCASLRAPARGPRERTSRAPARHRPHMGCVSRRKEQWRGLPLLERFSVRRRPLGAEHGGLFASAQREFLSCLGVRGGALSARPSEAKEEPISHFPRRCERGIG